MRNGKRNKRYAYVGLRVKDMKTVKVVAAVICDSMDEKNRYLLQPEVMVSLRASGNFREEKSKPVKHRSRLSSEK